MKINAHKAQESLLSARRSPGLIHWDGHTAHPCISKSFLSSLVYNHNLQKKNKQTHYEKAIVARAVCSSALLSGAAPFLQICRMG